MASPTPVSLLDGTSGSEATEDDMKLVLLQVKKAENCIRVGLSLFPQMELHEKVRIT